MVVRDTVVLTATLPRFLRTGDHGNVQLELDNVEGEGGDYSVAAAPRARAKFDSDKPQGVKLAAKQRGKVSVPVSADGSGPTTVKVSVSGPNGFALERAYALDVRPANQILTRRTVRSLAKGETLTLSNDLFADFVPGTGRVGLSVAGVDLARCGDAAQCARPLSVRLLGADHQPRGGDALRQRTGGAGAACARRRDRYAHQGRHRASAGAPGLQRFVRPVVGRRRRCLARCLCHPTS